VSANTDKHVKSILVNDDFINYVINPTNLLTEMWEDFFRIHPDQISIANEASRILLGKNNDKLFPDHEVKELKSRIFEKCGISPMC
jgi:hypothetical protein